MGALPVTEIQQSQEYRTQNGKRDRIDSAQAQRTPSEIVRELRQPFVIDPGMPWNGIGIHVGTRQRVMLNQVVRVVQMPPDVWIGHTAVSQSEDDRKNDEGEHDQKGNGRTQPLAPIRFDLRWTLIFLFCGD